jgi:hypothetical protein
VLAGTIVLMLVVGLVVLSASAARAASRAPVSGWPPLPKLPCLPAPGLSDCSFSFPALPGMPGSGATGSLGSLGLGGLGWSAVLEVLSSFTGGLLGPVVSVVVANVDLLVLTPHLTGQGRVQELWGHTLMVATTVLIVFVIGAGVVVMGHGSVQSRWGLGEMLGRLVGAPIAASVSLWLISQVISLTNALALALVGSDLGTQLLAGLLNTTSSLSLPDLLLQIVEAIALMVLLATAVLRIIGMILLIVAAPLALICHASPLTEGLARIWWRLLAALVVTQLGEALALAIALTALTESGRQQAGIGFGSGWVNLIVAICLFYIMIKIPGWAVRYALRRSRHTPVVVRLAAYQLLSRTVRSGLGHLVGSGLAARGAAAAAAATGAAAGVAGAAAGAAGGAAGGGLGGGGVRGGPGSSRRAGPGGVGGVVGGRGGRGGGPGGRAGGGGAAGNSPTARVPTLREARRFTQLRLPIPRPTPRWRQQEVFPLSQVPRHPRSASRQASGPVRQPPPPASSSGRHGWRQVPLPQMPRRAVGPRQLPLPFDPPARRRPRG